MRRRFYGLVFFLRQVEMLRDIAILRELAAKAKANTQEEQSDLFSSTPRLFFSQTVPLPKRPPG